MRIILGIIILIVFLAFAMLTGLFAYKMYNLKQYSKYSEAVKKIKLKSSKVKVIIFAICSAISIIAFVLIPFSFHQVNTGEIAVVKVWGKAEYTQASGTHFDFWIGKKYEKYDTKVIQTDSETMAYSQDAQTMDLTITVQYRIQVDKVLNINNEFGSLEILETRIKSVVEDRVKSIMSSMQAMNIIENRESISSQSIQVISDATKSYCIDIVNVLITNIDFSDAFEQAVEDKMIAEQQQLKAEYEAKRAEIEAQGKLEVAKLEAEAELEKAKKEAESTEVKAEAEAKALQIIQEAWNSIDESVREVMLKEMALESWNGELPATMVGTEFLEWLMGSIKASSTN